MKVVDCITATDSYPVRTDPILFSENFYQNYNKCEDQNKSINLICNDESDKLSSNRDISCFEMNERMSKVK